MRTLQAGSFDLSESGPAGYSSGTGYSCVGGTQTGQSVTVGIGGSATCTITNNDIAPKLHLRKVVDQRQRWHEDRCGLHVNADGTGANDLSGTSPVDSGASLQADTWTCRRRVVAGYTKSKWECVGGLYDESFGGVETIKVGLNGEATCTITNNDIAPKLHLRKIVTNDNGGTKTVADFTLNADGAGAQRSLGHQPGRFGLPA